MLFNPGVLALLSTSLLLCILTTGAIACGGMMIGWDPRDSGAVQLRRERLTLLIESVLKVVLWFELLSLLFFISIADRLHPLLPGAMCAAGTLNANPFGYPALTAKIAAVGLCSLWLMLNHASGVAGSIGMVRFKRAFMLAVWASLCVEGVLQFRFFVELDPKVLTSCCATIFSENAGGLSSNLIAAPVGASQATMLLLVPATIIAGYCVTARGSSPFVFSILIAAWGLAGAVAVVTWIAPAYYQLPTHHCPFCLLAPAFGRVGYPLLGSLGVAIITGLGAGTIRAARHLDSSGFFKVHDETRLCFVSMAGIAVFSTLSLWPVLGGGIRLEVF